MVLFGILSNNKAVKQHSLFDFEDKQAEECVLSARKHLFLINNMYAVLTFAKERKKEISNQGDSGANKVCIERSNEHMVG
jgi:hypothetical protein